MFQLKKNLVAIAVVLAVVLIVGGLISYRGSLQGNAVAKLREMKVQVFYFERPEIKQSYPFLENLVSDDFYLSVDTVNIAKGWDGDLDALLAALGELPSLHKVIFAHEDDALVQQVREKAPNLPVEVEEPDVLRAMAGGA
jgi:hypothetical protein